MINIAPENSTIKPTFNPHKRKFLDHNLTLAIRLMGLESPTNEIYTPKQGETAATVLLGPLPTEDKIKALQQKYPNKQFHVISFLDDEESKTILFKTINSKTKITTPTIIPIHDHSMLSRQTGKIFSITDFLNNFKSIPNTATDVVAINCKAGKGRSVVGTAIWLMSKNNMPLLTAMREITNNRSVAETIPGINFDEHGRPHKLLNPHAQGYLGYAFTHLLAKDINSFNENKDPPSLLDNFNKKIAQFSAAKIGQEYIRNSFRPLLLLPLGDMQKEDREELFKDFETVNKRFNILSILKDQPLSALEHSNLAFLQKHLKHDASAQEHAAQALLHFNDHSKQARKEGKYFSPRHFGELLTEFSSKNKEGKNQIPISIEKHITKQFNKIPNSTLKEEIRTKYEGIITASGENLASKLTQQPSHPKIPNIPKMLISKIVPKLRWIRDSLLSKPTPPTPPPSRPTM